MTFGQKLMFLRKMAVRILRDKDTYFKDRAWYESVVSKVPMDENGQPIPIYPYVMIDLLKQKLSPELRVFEFGSGFSTLFYQERVKQVCSVEHHEGWFEKIKAQAKSNVDIRHVSLEDGENYENGCKLFGEKFDLIVVDGRRRVKCAENCLPYLAENGVIIWDDSNRDRYQQGLRELQGKGFKRLDFYGLKATSWEGHQTTLFYRADNCLGI